MLDSYPDQTLKSVTANSCSLGFDRDEVTVGIVHLGPGAFHRAHQAVYTNEVLKLGAKQWGICEVSVNSSAVRDALAEQDNLYTLSILDKTPSQQLIGAIKEILVAPENPCAVINRMAAPATKVITLTITEKGYCLTPEGNLDVNNAAIVHDLANPSAPKSAIGFLVAALAQRFDQDIQPFTVISCDNLANNGQRLASAVTQFAQALNEKLGHWISTQVKFPSTMVDSITPATDDSVAQQLAQTQGVYDRWPIQREAFTQWVIEELPGVELPPWREVGVTFSPDVHGYETAKLRILNGLHSSMAFVGLLSGLETVEQAVTDLNIRAYLEHMLYDEIIPAVPSVEGLDLKEYGQSIIKRFENPAIRHLLSQIAWDSSQKIPFRLLATIKNNMGAHRDSTLLCFALAAWMKLIIKMTEQSCEITDPLAQTLQQVARRCTGDTQQDVGYFLALSAIFPSAMCNSPEIRADICQAYQRLGVSTQYALENIKERT